MPNWIGLDVHKRTCHATVLDERGVIVQTKLQNEPEELKQFFENFDDAKVAMEAAYFWQPVYELIEQLGHEVVLAHPKETRIIAKRKVKTDAKDSEALAYLLQLGWLPTAYVPPKEIRGLRELVRLHVYLVHERTRFKNKVRAELAKRWFKLVMNPFTKRGRQRLAELDSRTVRICTDIIESLDKNIKELERELKSRAGESEEARLLMSIPGVGYFSALAVLAELGDVERFPDEKKVCAYAGLVPSLHQSGNLSRLGHVTKEGSPLLRWVLVQCAWMHLQHAENTGLTRFFWRIARRKGSKVAILAMARKLLVTMYWMLKRHEEFRAH
jgi:transposase